jgi:hypothetical protein
VAECKPASRGHRRDGVQHQVDEHLLHLVGIRPDRQWRETVLHFDPVPRDLILQKLQGLRHEGGQVAIGDVRHVHGGVIEQLRYRPADPLQAFRQHLQVATLLLRCQGPRFEGVDAVHRSRQGAVDLVGDSRRQGSDRRHLLRPRKQILCSFPLGFFLREPVDHHPVAVLEIAQLIVSLREGDRFELPQPHRVEGAHQAPDRPDHDPGGQDDEEDHARSGGDGHGERFPLQLP